MTKEMYEMLSKMSLNDLHELNHVAVGLIKDKRYIESSSIALDFRIGDMVNFSHPKKGSYTGKIVKLKRIKALVLVNNIVPAIRWDVPFNMLTKVINAQPTS